MCHGNARAVPLTCPNPGPSNRTSADSILCASFCFPFYFIQLTLEVAEVQSGRAVAAGHGFHCDGCEVPRTDTLAPWFIKRDGECIPLPETVRLPRSLAPGTSFRRSRPGVLYRWHD